LDSEESGFALENAPSVIARGRTVNPKVAGLGAPAGKVCGPEGAADSFCYSSDCDRVVVLVPQPEIVEEMVLLVNDYNNRYDYYRNSNADGDFLALR